MSRPAAGDSQKGARLADVARHAGVSIATASRAIHGAEGRVVTEELRQRVLAAASELGYVLNTNAQAVARGRADVLALVVHDISDPYFSTIAAGVMAAAGRAGRLVTLAVTNRDPQQEVAYVRTFRQNRSRAVVLVGSRTSAQHHAEALTRELAAFEAEGGRVVLVSQPLLPFDTVAFDNRGGAQELAEHLAELGYRSFGVLSGPRGLVTAADRLTGFRRGLSKHGIGLERAAVHRGEFTRDGGYQAMAELLSSGQSVDCVFATNDVMAVGAIACLRDHGRRVPQDVAVAGFDDISMLRDVAPALTSVQLPLESTGEAAAALALAPAASDRRVVTVAGRVVLRASTPPVTATELG